MESAAGSKFLAEGCTWLAGSARRCVTDRRGRGRRSAGMVVCRASVAAQRRLPSGSCEAIEQNLGPPSGDTRLAAVPSKARSAAVVIVSTAFPSRVLFRIRLYYTRGVAEERFDPDLLDERDPFEVDSQAAHLHKHLGLGIADIEEVWESDPLFYPAKPPAHWLMVAEVAGRVLMVPLAPARSGDVRRCRPIGCYEAAPGLASQYRRDR